MSPMHVTLKANVTIHKVKKAKKTTIKAILHNFSKAIISKLEQPPFWLALPMVYVSVSLCSTIGRLWKSCLLLDSKTILTFIGQSLANCSYWFLLQCEAQLKN